MPSENDLTETLAIPVFSVAPASDRVLRLQTLAPVEELGYWGIRFPLRYTLMEVR